MRSKIISVVLTLTMILSFVPIQVFAAEGTGTEKDFITQSSITLGVSQKTKIVATGESQIADCEILSNEVISVNEIDIDSNCVIVEGLSVGISTLKVFDSDGNYDVIEFTVKPAPTSIKLSSTLKLGAGEVYSLNSVVSPADAYGALTWSSDNTRVVKVNESGVLTAVAPGTANVSVRAYNGVKAVCAVKVYNAPSTVSLSKTSMVIGVGDSYSFTMVYPKSCYWYGRVFSVSDKNIVNMSGSKMTAIAPGTATVYVKLTSGKTASCKVTVVDAPNLLSIDNSIKIGVGESFSLSSKYNPSNINCISTSFVTDDNSVASVSSTGVVKGIKKGTTNIHCVSYNGVHSNNCEVTVLAAPTKVTLNKSSLTLGKGEKYTLKATFPVDSYSSKLTYTTSNTKIVTVTSKGELTAKANGTARITVKTYNGKTATCTVTVKSAPSKISLNKTSLVMGVGETYDLDSTVPSSTASFFRQYTSSNPSVVSVKSNGVITVFKTGTAKIIVRTFNGKAATCTVTVKKAPTSAKLNNTSVTMKFGSTYQLSLSVNSGAASNKKIWTTTNKNIATVSASGKVYTKSWGYCHIIGTTYNGIQAKCKVTIKKPKYAYLVSSYTTYFPTNTNVGKPKNIKLACQYINGKSGGYVLKSSETFSFNKAVGRRTSQRGFVSAYITAGNGYSNGIGGGICQAATTIFNAAFFGNFSIRERSCHALKSSYCPVGMDAAIFWGSQDLKIRNNYNCAVLVKMIYNASGSVTCKIYSEKKIKLKSVKSKVTYNKSKKTYTTKRYYGGVCNYTTTSRYND